MNDPRLKPQRNKNIRSKKSFEVVQAYLHRFLKHYSDLIMATPELREASKALRDEQVTLDLPPPPPPPHPPPPPYLGIIVMLITCRLEQFPCVASFLFFFSIDTSSSAPFVLGTGVTQVSRKMQGRPLVSPDRPPYSSFPSGVNRCKPWVGSTSSRPLQEGSPTLFVSNFCLA